MMIMPIGNESNDLPKLREIPASEPAKATNTPKREEASPVKSERRTDKVIESGLRFSVEESLGKVIISVINPESGEVIRQIPPEELMALSKFLESTQGNLLNLFS